jgi:hypothetical protein
MVTAATHHRFNSGLWGGEETRKLWAELTEIDASADAWLGEHAACQSGADFKSLAPLRVKGGWAVR